MKLSIIAVLLVTTLGGTAAYFLDLFQTQPRSLPKAEAVAELAAPEVPQVPAFVDYQSLVAPIVSQRCESCHNRETLRDSALWADLQQFCGETLSAKECASLHGWKDAGAHIPSALADWSDLEREHWSFRPLQTFAVPAFEFQNPIDAFIHQPLEEAGLRMADRDHRDTLIRRLTFHITGLPPSLEQLDRWRSADSSIDAIIDELMGSPAFGEHWARHWLDLVRYADTNGYEDDGPKPLAWKYRDFVIRAFNDDVPYDKFVRMQLAGGLKTNPTSDDFIAVGFLRLGPWDSEPDDVLQSHFDQVDDMVSTIGTAFLGLSVGCARCHDHPEEPITARDYAAMAACFHGLHRPTKGRLEEHAPSATADQLAQANDVRAQIRQFQRLAIEETSNRQSKIYRKQARDLEREIHVDSAYRFVETATSGTPGALFHRGNPHRPLEHVSPAPLSVLSNIQFDQAASPRQQLADWMFDEQSGLLARVMVNRVWMWHFGRGLVESPSNFGLSGAEPSHPELLEWLAAWFAAEANWSVKKLHRLILTSAAFQTSAHGTPQQQELFGAYQPQRLRAEAIHDALLSVSGLLDLEMYGPPEYSKLPDYILSSLVEQGQWQNETSSHRRAIYQIVKRNLPRPILGVFDFPESSSSCAARNTSVSAQQSLTLWNSEFAVTSASELSRRLADANIDPSRQIEMAYEICFGRQPNRIEMDRLRDYMDLRTNEGAVPNDILEEICLVLLNLNEFVVVE